MLVTKRNFDEFLSVVTKEKKLAYDTETTTLWWWRSLHHSITPMVFAAQFSTATQNFYLDFLLTEDKLGDAAWQKLQVELFSNPETLWYIHNAKFDLHQSANHGAEFKGTVHCTQAIARVMNNLEDWDSTGQKKIKGAFKLDTLAAKYLNENKIELTDIPTTKIRRWGKERKKEADNYVEFAHFDKLPLDKLIDYGCRDTSLAYKLGEFQERAISSIDEQYYLPLKRRTFGTLTDLMNEERKLTKVLFEMEREGVKLDMEYTERAYWHEIAKSEEYEKEFEALCKSTIGEVLDVNAPRQLVKLFDALGHEYKFTDKGNACFDADALERSDSPVAKLVLEYRYHTKRARTYFENFVWIADASGVLHCNLQQGGADTGRMSCWEPNLQNVPKRSDKQEKDFPVRRCFIPKPGGFFADKDYKAAEYRMMFDYANEVKIIEKIKNGLDPHVATKEQMPDLKDRDDAKTMNFRVLYGSGVMPIGYALGAKTDWEAKKKGAAAREKYYSELPGVKNFIFNVRDAANNRGFIINWAGRFLKYDRQSSYKSPNGLIQGGVGDMSKISLIRCAEILKGKQSKMLLQVHDATLFWIAYGEEYLIEPLQDAMRKVYPFKSLPQDVDANYSNKSWGELVETPPCI